MPNGFSGSHTDWQRNTDELKALGSVLDSFAEEYGLNVQWHDHNWPSWSARKNTDLNRLIQIYLDGENESRWHLWICASLDRDDVRYWKKRTLKDSAPLAEIEFKLSSQLLKAWGEVSEWSESDLDAI